MHDRGAVGQTPRDGEPRPSGKGDPSCRWDGESAGAGCPLAGLGAGSETERWEAGTSLTG